MKNTALITGASSGIGRDIARELAALGYDLILVARRTGRLEELASELNLSHQTSSLVLPCDLTDKEQLNSLMGRTSAFLQQERQLTTLVNNAGTGYWDYFDNQSAQNIQQDIDLNITALTSLSHAFVRIAQQHGQESSILNIGSLAALLPTPRYAVYSASKSYVLRFSKILAYEIKKQKLNMTVTCVCPGGVLTEFMQHSGQELKGEIGMMSSAQVARKSVAAMLRGKGVYIPGLLNKISALTRFLPAQINMKIVEKSMLITVKDK